MYLDLVLTHQQIRAQEVEGKTCVVIDTLRATSTIVTALHFGCAGVIPALSPEGALELMGNRDDCIVGGEWEGEQLAGLQKGNSPLEYRNGNIRGKVVILVTTNGTRTLLKVQKAQQVCLCALLNLDAVARWLATGKGKEVLICCAGTRGDFSLEDYFTAGFLLSELLRWKTDTCYSNLALAALGFYRSAVKDQNVAVLELLKTSDNGKRLWEAGAHGDLQHCSRISIYPVVPIYREGIIKKAGDFTPC